jgi:hypothetical protein
VNAGDSNTTKLRSSIPRVSLVLLVIPINSCSPQQKQSMIRLQIDLACRMNILRLLPTKKLLHEVNSGDCLGVPVC